MKKKCFCQLFIDNISIYGSIYTLLDFSRKIWFRKADLGSFKNLPSLSQ